MSIKADGKPGGADQSLQINSKGAFASSGDMATQVELDAEATARAVADTTHAALTTAAHGGIVASSDVRLTDSRTPNGSAGGVLSGTYPNPGFAADMATQAELDAEATARASADTTLQTNIDAKAPVGATYITQTSQVGLSAEQSLSSLATGYMKVASGTGVITSQGIPIPIADGGTGAATAAANRVLVGPTSGGAVAPTFRALVNDDIPTGLDMGKFTTGQLPLLLGGTGTSMSASGGANQIVKQITLGGSLTVDLLVAADIPNLDTSKITSGLLALARGGSGADLSATGGANQLVRQSTAGGALTVSALAAADIPALDAAKITTGALVVARGGTGVAALPAFSVYKNANQTGIVTLTSTKLAWQVEVFDNNANFASDRFTPTVAGKYLLACSLLWNSTAMEHGKDLVLYMYKNGVAVKDAFIQSNVAGKYQGQAITVVLDANGSTDYFEIFAYHGCTANQTFYGSATGYDTHWSGCWVAP